MKQYFDYIKYLTRHRFFVMTACFKHGLIWRGLKHDMSKYHPKEFFAYANKFFREDKEKIERDETGYYPPTKIKEVAFQKAWNHHVRKNDHHWQFWINIDDKGSDSFLLELEMPKQAVKEMICDWIGARKAQRNTTPTRTWFELHKDKMYLHSNTKKLIYYYIDKWNLN
jgi:hypothetical protein